MNLFGLSLVETEQLDRIELTLVTIQKKLKHMAETQDQEAADLNALAVTVGNIKQGILDLEAKLAEAGGVSPAVQTALDNLKAAVGDASSALPAAPAPAPEGGETSPA
jgi:hypothetical protein